MSKKDVFGNMNLSKFEDLFQSGDGKEKSAGYVQEIPLSALHEFQHHPFKIRSDEELTEMIQSIREKGVLVPGIARKRAEGGYEIIAGHTRCHVCRLLGLKTMPMLVREIDDDEACIMMVDSNIQREDILPSEKARAYQMKYDSIKNQGKSGNSLKAMEEENGESYKKIQRYIWLARLRDELLELVDQKQLGFVQGVSISALPDEEQATVYQVLKEWNIKLSTVQAKAIKQFSAEGNLTKDALVRYLTDVQQPQKKRKDITLKKDWLGQFFGEEYNEHDMMNVIRELLLDWKEREHDE